MGGWLWSPTDFGWLAFIVLDGLGALAAIATGRSFAKSWSPLWLALPATIALAAAVHFLHYALFQEDLTAVYYYGVTFVLMLIAAVLGYQTMRSRQMGTQYSWAFRSAGLTWRSR